MHACFGSCAQDFFCMVGEALISDCSWNGILRSSCIILYR